jgi:hypothetical protein
MNAYSVQLRWILTAAIAVFIMVESGFTPALSLLAGAVCPGPDGAPPWASTPFFRASAPSSAAC